MIMDWGKQSKRPNSETKYMQALTNRYYIGHVGLTLSVTEL